MILLFWESFLSLNQRNGTIYISMVEKGILNLVFLIALKLHIFKIHIICVRSKMCFLSIRNLHCSPRAECGRCDTEEVKLRMMSWVLKINEWVEHASIERGSQHSCHPIGMLYLEQ